MKYGTLTNDNLSPAPLRIVLDGWQILNPTDEQYEAAGYLPVRYTDAPVAPEGYYPVSGWEEHDGEIVQVWHFEAIPPEAEPTRAWDITQGEYIGVGDLVSHGGVIYRCISGHYAAWSKQPPNEDYWEEEPI